MTRCRASPATASRCACRKATTSPNGRRLREVSRAFLDALGADLAGRRSHARRLPPQAQALHRRPARRSRLRLPDLPQRRQRHGRRADARQYPPRRGAGRLHRLLGRRAVCPPGLHDRGHARAHSVLFWDTSSAPAGGGLHSHQCRLDRRSWKRPDSSAKAMRGLICASTASGRIICSTRGSRTTAISCFRCLGLATLALL